MILLVNIANVI